MQTAKQTETERLLDQLYKRHGSYDLDQLQSSCFKPETVGGKTRYRLHYEDDVVEASIVTDAPNSIGIFGNLGLAGQETMYEVLWIRPFSHPVTEPQGYIKWDEIMGVIRYLHFVNHHGDDDA